MLDISAMIDADVVPDRESEREKTSVGTTKQIDLVPLIFT